MSQMRLIQSIAILAVSLVAAGCSDAKSKVCTLTPMQSAELLWTPDSAEAPFDGIGVFATFFEHHAIPEHELVLRVFLVDEHQVKLLATSSLRTDDPHRGIAILAHDKKSSSGEDRPRHAFAANITTARGGAARQATPVPLTLDGSYKLESSSVINQEIRLSIGKEMFLATLLFASPEGRQDTKGIPSIQQIIEGSPASQAIDQWMETFKTNTDAKELSKHLSGRSFVFATLALLPAGKLDRANELPTSETLSQP